MRRDDWDEVDVRDHGYRIVEYVSDLSGLTIVFSTTVSYEGKRHLTLLTDQSGGKWYMVLGTDLEIIYDPWLWIVLAKTYDIITHDEYVKYHQEAKSSRLERELEEARSLYKKLTNKFGAKLHE